MRHWLTLTIAIALVVVLLKFVFEDWLHMPFATGVERILAEPGPAAAALVVGLLSIDLFLPVPSSLVMILSGVLFGVWRGALLALAGSLIGNWAGFELARRYGHDTARRLVGAAQLERMGRVFARHGAAAILVTRPVPVLMETLSVVAGLSGMRRGTFLAASLAGTIPTVFAYAYAGALSIAVGSVFPAVLGLMIVVAAGWTLARARLKLTARSSSFSASRD